MGDNASKIPRSREEGSGLLAGALPAPLPANITQALSNSAWALHAVQFLDLDCFRYIK